MMKKDEKPEKEKEIFVNLDDSVDLEKYREDNCLLDPEAFLDEPADENEPEESVFRALLRKILGV